MKYIIAFFISITLLLIVGCDDNEQSKTACEELPQWSGYDKECGCYGIPIAFSEKCITSFMENNIPYFGYINHGHIKDSILLIFREDSKIIALKTISDIPSLDSKSDDIQKYIDENKMIQFMYDESNWDNPEALGRATEVRIDPTGVIEKPEQIELHVYQRAFFSLGSEILDSMTIVVTKDLDRK